MGHPGVFLLQFCYKSPKPVDKGRCLLYHAPRKNQRALPRGKEFDMLKFARKQLHLTLAWSREYAGAMRRGARCAKGSMEDRRVRPL